MDGGSVNKCIIMGNVGRDPEVKTMRGGDDLVNLSVATSESWKDKRSGERVEKTEWHRVVIFNPHLVKIVAQYVKKGTSVYIEGQVQTRKWTAQDGAERMTTEVVIPRVGGTLKVLDKAKGKQEQPAAQRGKEYAGTGTEYDDEIPF